MINKIIPISGATKIELIKEQGFEIYLKTIAEIKNVNAEFLNKVIYGSQFKKALKRFEYGFMYISIDKMNNTTLKGFVLLTSLQFYLDMQIDLICGDFLSGIYGKMLAKSMDFCKNMDLKILSSYIFWNEEFIKIYSEEGFIIDEHFDENNPLKLLKLQHIF